MEYTELADYPMPSGRVTAWQPAVDEGSWIEDPRRLSYMHHEHALRAAHEGDDWYSQWIGTAFLIERPLDHQAFDATVLRWYERHEVFRTSVALQADDDAPLDRITVDMDAISIETRVLGESLSSTAAFEIVNEYFNTTVTPLRWPHCIAVTVEPVDRDDAFLVIFAADHTVMDAYTQVFAINELTAIYEAKLNGTDDGLPDFGSYVDYSDAERALGDRIDASDDAVAQWTDFFARAAETPTQPDPMPTFPIIERAVTTDAASPIRPHRVPDQGFQATLSSWLLDAERTEAFHRVCKAFGANMQAGIYTALAIATERLTGTGRLRFISPIHTRTELRWGEAAGWFVGIVPVHLDPGDARTFGEAITRVAESAGRYRGVGQAPYARIADIIGGTATPPGLVISYIDLRHAQGADQWSGRSARVLRSANRCADEVYLWINRVPSGTNVSARFPGGDRADEVHRFISTFHAVLDEVIDAGDTSVLAPDTSTAAMRR